MFRQLSLWVPFLVFAFVSFAQPGPPPQAQKAAPQKLDSLWADLAGADAAKAYRAIGALVRTPGETVAFFEKHLRSAVAPDRQKVERWIKDLDSDNFSVRDQASRELEKLGELAGAALRTAHQANIPLESRRRLEKLLNNLSGPVVLPDQLRALRAVETLEYIGTEEAKKLLRRYAAGAREARLTEEARETLTRLDKRPADTPPTPTAPEKQTRTDLYGDPLPAGAVARLGTIRFRRAHHGLSGLAFLADGKSLLTAGQGNGVQVWDAASGRLSRELRTEPLSMSGFALAADGKHFAVAGSHPWIGNMPGPSEVRIVDLSSGKVLRSLSRKNYLDVHECNLAFSPDGKHLFSLGDSGTLRVEEIASGKELLHKVFPRDGGKLALSADGEHLAVASGVNTNKLFLWKWSNEEPRELQVPRYGAYWIRFSADGKLLAAVGYFTGDLRVWEVASRRFLYERQAPDTAYSFFGQPSFTPDGKTLALSLREGSGRGRIQLLEPATGHPQGVLETSGSSLAFAGNSQLLAMSAGQGIRIWDMTSRKELGPRDDAPFTDPSHIRVSSKGFLVTASDDNTVRIWDTASSRQRRKFTLDRWVRDIALSPDSSLLAASSFDDAVHVWDSRTGREIYRLAGHGQVGGRRTLAFLPDGRSFLSWGDDFYLRRWDVKTGKAMFEHAIRPSGITIPDEEDDIASEELRKTGFGSAAFSPDGKMFVLDFGGNYHFFDTSTGKEKLRAPSDGSIGGHMTASQNSKYLLASAWGSQGLGGHPVSLLDFASGKLLRRMLLPGRSAGPVAFSADGRAFATTVESSSSKIVVYEMSGGDIRCTIQGYRGQVRSLAFFPDGRRLAAGLSDSTVVIWDLTSPEILNNKGR